MSIHRFKEKELQKIIERLRQEYASTPLLDLSDPDTVADFYSRYSSRLRPELEKVDGFLARSRMSAHVKVYK